MNFAFWFLVLAVICSLKLAVDAFLTWEKATGKSKRIGKILVGFSWIVFAAIFALEAIRQYIMGGF